MSDEGARIGAPVDVVPPAPAPRGALVLPRLIVDAGPVAAEKFLEFFAARIANRRTRAAYGRAVGQFLAWCAARGLGLTAVAPLHVAAYIRTHPGSAPTEPYRDRRRPHCLGATVFGVKPVLGMTTRGRRHPMFWRSSSPRV